jgi:hypothetical protein
MNNLGQIILQSQPLTRSSRSQSEKLGDRVVLKVKTESFSKCEVAENQRVSRVVLKWPYTRSESRLPRRSPSGEGGLLSASYGSASHAGQRSRNVSLRCYSPGFSSEQNNAPLPLRLYRLHSVEIRRPGRENREGSLFLALTPLPHRLRRTALNSSAGPVQASRAMSNPRIPFGTRRGAAAPAPVDAPHPLPRLEDTGSAA